MKWNERDLDHFCAHADTGFEIQTLEVWGRARYLSVTEAAHK